MHSPLVCHFFLGKATTKIYFLYSLRSVALLAGVLARSGQRGQHRRHADADKGVITWKTPDDVAKFIKKDYKEKVAEMEKNLQKETQSGSSEVMSSALDAVREELKANL